MARVPKVLRATRTWAPFVPGILTSVVPLVWVLVIGMPRSVWVAVPVSVTIMLLGGVYIFFMFRWSRRLGKTIRDAKGAVCVDCAYPLDQLREPTVCPECGLAIPADRHASVWREHQFDC
ncbi:MAG: hypothetical protein K2X32_09405 [Phycisphaerales bacterium]|nr:hypothetical protein [Phycisphaerales bacterium]